MEGLVKYSYLRVDNLIRNNIRTHGEQNRTRDKVLSLLRSFMFKLNCSLQRNDSPGNHKKT
jgi:hypothetical protein